MMGVATRVQQKAHEVSNTMMGVATRVQQKAHEVSNTMMGVATRVQQKAHEVSNMIMGVATRVQQKAHEAWRIYQHYIDKINAHPTYRWIVTLVVALAFCLRVYYTRFYLIVYGLGLYILHLLVEFLSPLLDPVNDAPYLPIRASDEFKPFIRRLPEFKFWFSMTMAFCISLVLTFFPEFNIPLKWQVLLIWWLGFLIIAIKSLISQMIKYKYIPFSFGKKKYGDRSSSGSRAE